MAHPLHPRSLSKRSPSPRLIGTGFAIAISIMIFGAIVFYLGMQRERTGTWFCWREPISPSHFRHRAHTRSISSPSHAPKSSTMDPEKLKSRISCPIFVNASAPVELSPVEASPKFLELPGWAHVHEMDDGRPSWFDRKSWFRKSNAAGHERKKSHKSLYELNAGPPSPPAYPEAAWTCDIGRRKESGMDWSGLEHVRKMYENRGSVHRAGT